MLVPKSVISELLKITYRDSSRYALDSILLERQADGSPVAVASDGQRLVAYTWQEPESHPFKPSDAAPREGFSVLLSAAACKQIKSWKLTTKGPRAEELNCVYVDEYSTRPQYDKDTGEISERIPTLAIRATDLSANYSIEDATGEGRFPKWRDCMPAERSGSVSVTLDAKLLAEIADVARKLATSEVNNGITLTVRDRESAVKLEVDRRSACRFSAVLMPIHWDCQPESVHGAADRIARERQEAAEAAALAEADEHELVEETSPELAESNTVLEPDTALEPVA